jgi:predicted methyltransferase
MMTQMRNRIGFGSLLVIVLAALFVGATRCAEAATDGASASPLKAAIDGPQRSDANRARDKYRHPMETLSFFGMRPDMTVVEISPGTGWYTEILAPLLKDHGKLYEAVGGRGVKPFEEKLKSDPAVFGNVIVTRLDPPSDMTIAPAGSADMVLTFRNVHDWLPHGTAAEYFKAFYRALKPGGILGVTDHRADPLKPQDPNAKDGYVRQDYMIHLAEQAGFKLIGTSEINANPKDDRDHPVWNLPPTLRMGDKDRARYLVIGESDRMTLKFVKPITQAGAD